MSTQTFFRKLRKRKIAILFVLPATLTLLAITIFPLLYELRLAFMSWELAMGGAPRFVGLKNFVEILTDDARFWASMKVTAILMVVGVAIQLSLGTTIALLLNRVVGRWRSPMVSLFLIPVMIAPVVAGFQFRMIYHNQFGPLNYLIELITFGRWDGMAWIADPKVALFAVMMADVWQWTPFLMLIVLAGLQSISPDMYEAAEIDGASSWQSFWRITIPLISSVVIVGVLIRVMDMFKLFDIIYLVTGGGPGNVTETISFYTYLQGFKFFSLGYTAAMAFLQLIVIILISQVFLKYQKILRGAR
ncbi:ABC transporter permease subunit [candidate division KSB3 bacterium]|uniref:ABC transporter permease subunit n=1 Tax=candidate division KSB3 bacterium TaxID=2044937 RepID=A0A9D5Q5H3_9BACT|nr:ABC transporter permease subunit [candidate division KSB3 bacterium]MBD3324824.1 ABC transporter permease subunit [candidate division KSB3 bacterium]